MKTIAILTIVAILAAGVVASLIPIQQSSAAPGSPKVANGEGSSNSNSHAYNDGTAHAYSQTPANQPCSTHC